MGEIDIIESYNQYVFKDRKSICGQDSQHRLIRRFDMGNQWGVLN